MIQTEGILKSFGTLKVLDGVELNVDEREIVAIVGASGAGKTTLLQIIGTLLKADSGIVKIGGIDVTGLSERKLADFRNQKLGFVFQFHHLLPEFTAIENACMPALIANKSMKDARTLADELFRFLNLTDRAQHKPSQLSGGEQQRVAVARALINQPNVVLADEPSGNLDVATKKELHDLFFKLRDRYGHTFVIVTHDMELAAMADRTLTMQKGKVLT